jgi:hypothetical protein
VIFQITPRAISAVTAGLIIVDIVANTQGSDCQRPPRIANRWSIELSWSLLLRIDIVANDAPLPNH